MLGTTNGTYGKGAGSYGKGCTNRMRRWCRSSCISRSRSARWRGGSGRGGRRPSGGNALPLPSLHQPQVPPSDSGHRRDRVQMRNGHLPDRSTKNPLAKETGDGGGGEPLTTHVVLWALSMRKDRPTDNLTNGTDQASAEAQITVPCTSIQPHPSKRPQIFSTAGPIPLDPSRQIQTPKIVLETSSYPRPWKCTSSSDPPRSATNRPYSPSPAPAQPRSPTSKRAQIPFPDSSSAHAGSNCICWSSRSPHHEHANKIRIKLWSTFSTLSNMDKLVTHVDPIPTCPPITPDRSSTQDICCPPPLPKRREICFRSKKRITNILTN